MLCAICRKNEATQKHHLSYQPSLLIELCKDCHQLLHQNHGVGVPRVKQIKEEKKVALRSDGLPVCDDCEKELKDDEVAFFFHRNGNCQDNERINLGFVCLDCCENPEVWRNMKNDKSKPKNPKLSDYIS